MSIFGKIKDAIFGGRADDRGTVEPPAATPVDAVAPSAPAPQTSAPIAGQAVPQSDVDVQAVLTEMAHANGEDLDWKRSIVDLMKLLGLDPSLEHRAELAGELGYTGARNGSAEMNIWLHKAVMRELAKNGGVVPDYLAI